MQINSATQTTAAQMMTAVLNQTAATATPTNEQRIGGANAAQKAGGLPVDGLPAAGKPVMGRIVNNDSSLQSVVAGFLKILEKLLSLLMQMMTGGNKDAGSTSKDKAHNDKTQKGGGAEPQMKDVGGRMAVPVDGPQGFLFKPASDSDGKLVVLVPKQMRDNVASIKVKDESGKALSSGTLKGTFGDGRDIFRFDKSGSSLPKNVTVEVTLKDGSVKKYPIADPSKRYD